MQFFLIVKASLNRPYAYWVERFDADDVPRRASGVDVVFRHPVIGEQAVVFGVRVDDPRQVHDMMYDLDFRKVVEESGLVVGSEQILVCQGDA